MSDVGKTGMILAAGFGTRMRPLTDTLPKPLISVGGITLLDRALDQMLRAGVGKAVVNVHYLAEQIETHVARQRAPAIVISDEREKLLDTGGGLKKALPHLEDHAFFVSNGDSLWVEGAVPLLQALRSAWRDDEMDCLLALAPIDALGYEGDGDFHLASDGRLRRAQAGPGGAYVATGIYLVHPRLFENAPDEPFSMNLLWDRAIADGRLHGLLGDGEWMHVGTPGALADAEARLLELGV